MLLTFLLLAAEPQDARAMIAAAAGRLSVACTGADCAAPPRPSRYRIDGDDAPTSSAKDRAIGDDGSKCNVVGAQRCTKRGRTIFRTDLTN